MAIEQDFLPYAVGGSANVLSQSAYAALTSLLQNGLTSGIVPSNELNKILRQPSIIASVVAQFIVNQTGQPAIDDGTTATLLTNLATAVAVSARQNPVLTDTGAANAYVVANLSAFSAYPTVSGLIIDVSITNANTGASTLNVDGLGTKPILGLGLQPLQGGELIVKGVACLMYVVASTVNGGNGAWIVMECTGGAQQIPPATQSQHAPQMGQVAGVVGSARNLVMSVTAASATATLTADEIIVETALGGVRYCLANFSKTINLATTGAGGMDTGSAPVSGFVALYAIWNPTTSTAALLAKAEGGSAATSIYNGANMPAGYTASALVGVWPTNASSQFIVGIFLDRSFSMVGFTAINTSALSPSLTSLGISTIVPKSARSISGSVALGSTVATTLSYSVAGSSATVGASSNQGSNSQGIGGGYGLIPLVTQQTMYYQCAASAGTTSFTISISGYTI